MTFTDKDKENLKLAMIKKYGKTSMLTLANDLGVSRMAVNKAITNKPSFDKLREKLKEWIKENK